MENLENNEPKKISGSKKKKAVVVKEKAIGGMVMSYEVKSKGYKETFNNLEDANKQVDILRKRAIKNQEAFDIKVHANLQDDTKPRLERAIKIDESFYSN